MPASLGMDDRYIPSSRDSLVKFDAVSGETSEKWEFESAFFKEHLKPAAYFCYVSPFLESSSFNAIKIRCGYKVQKGKLGSFSKKIEKATMMQNSMKGLTQSTNDAVEATPAKCD